MTKVKCRMRLLARLLLVPLLFQVAELASAQSIDLHGVVVIQNSQYETGRRVYVKDASIRSQLAKPVTTDEQGTFALVFAGVPMGTPVQLAVTKPGLEVVNATDVGHAILGAAAPLEIVMADPEKLAEARSTYFMIATEAISKVYHRKMAVLKQEDHALAERLAAFSSEHAKEISSMVEAIDVLTIERDQAQQHAADLADRFATTDLDKASKAFRVAFDMFRRGEVDSALAGLSEERLDADHASARSKKGTGEALVEAANEAIRQTYQSYGLKADVLGATMDHRGMLEVLDRMAVILKADPDAFPPSAGYELAAWRGDALSTVGRNVEACEEYSLGLALVRERLGPEHLEQIRFLTSWAEVAQQLDSLVQATRLVDEGFALIHGREVEYPLLLADLEIARGGLWMTKGDPLAAKPHYKKCIELRRSHLPVGDFPILACQADLAIAHNALGENEESIALLEAVRDQAGVDCKRLGTARGTHMLNLGAIHSFTGRFDKGEPLLRLSLDWLAQDLGPDHPEILGAYCILAGNLAQVGRYEEAVAFVDTALAIARRAVPENSSTMAHVLSSRAGVFAWSRDYGASLENNLRALGIFLKLYGEAHLQTAKVRDVIGRDRSATGDVEGALVEYSTALETYRTLFGPEHPEVFSAGCKVASSLELLGRDSAALSLFGTYLPSLRATKGYADPELLGHEFRMARLLYRQGDLDSARTVLEGTLLVRPIEPVEWLLYRIASDQGREVDALDHVVRCIRLENGSSPEEHRNEVRGALNELATRLDRKDVLEEFERKE